MPNNLTIDLRSEAEKYEEYLTKAIAKMPYEERKLVADAAKATDYFTDDELEEACVR